MGPRQNPRRFGRRSKQASSACRSDGQVYLGIWRCGMTWLRPRKQKRDAILGLVASWGDRRTPRASLQRNPRALSMRLVGIRLVGFAAATWWNLPPRVIYSG